MQAAEKNLTERGGELTAEFRRRQDAITAELLDVVGGYEAALSQPDPPTSPARAEA